MAFSPDTSPSSPPHTAVLIGRFQPWHNGHMALLQAALQQAQQVVVVLGSAHQARSPKNPFTWQERAAMVQAALSPAERARVHCIPVRDHYNEARWVEAVRAGVQALVPPGAAIALVGHFKDSSSSYLQSFPGWQLLSLPRLGAFDATPLREIYWNASAAARSEVLAALAPQVPAPVLDFLQAWMDTPDYGAMQHEAAMLRSYHAAWACAPYPPVFVTVDALLLCNGHLLLIERGHAPGKGLWALPGGFIEPRDSLWQSCLRELQEETGCAVDAQALEAALQGVQVFDHPDRSLRGRTITHVHVFDLGERAQLPAVQGGDDAALARWVPLAQLPALETRFFEDHFHVIQRCLENICTTPLSH
ncbi:bifunctional nicotinamide-nucleotide adenylyltransferase/Nudix hydroxylase [Pantoea sp. 18069]|uniref:bifunctional nicotinamide-nucleotide adenylyltransferase/Nudix hydroxylase n=1 Tax=Pantoea sp. 18069 TaxID=2681415 RepID=UPI00135C2E84|nr:bifunctional nicotinamide-nucleotide adenylyltransferase/Nudix hydroxylase [Pantoea sp. 18069]